MGGPTMGGGRGMGGGGGGGGGRSHFDDLDDAPDIGALPSLDDAPRGGGFGGPGRGGINPNARLVDQVKPPTFDDDDLDDEEMAREEAALLARVKANKFQSGPAESAAPAAKPMPPAKHAIGGGGLGGGGAAVAVGGGGLGGGKSSGASPMAPGATPGGMFGDIDDLSEEEL